jgi:hypothetical protein
MTTWVATAARELFRREIIPPRLRWWFAAEAMCQWYALLRRDLAPHLGGEAAAAAIVAELSAPMFRRRYDVLRAAHPSLPDRAADPRAVGLVLGAIYRAASNPEAAWIFSATGGAPSSFDEHLRAERALAAVSIEARWVEATHHLGELLIALTDGLPGYMDRARPVLGELCFAAGVRFGKKMKKAWGLPATPESALEVLRMSEYIFRVNPEHWGATDAAANTGYLEGTACPWFAAPGWNGAHCGIFGQFQSGICAVFGLRYHLTTTIPKHGGTTCRIDVRPISLRRGAASAEARAGAGAGGEAKASAP